MRKSLLVAGLVFLVGTVAVRQSLSQNPVPDYGDPSEVEVSPLETGQALEAEETDVQDVQEADAQSDLAQLRKHYADLAVQRAAVMTSDELNQAIAEAGRALREKAAEQELERATAILKKLAADHPETPAAKKATRALDALRPKPTASDTSIFRSDATPKHERSPDKKTPTFSPS